MYDLAHVAAVSVVTDAHDDDLRIWRPGDACVTTAEYAVYDRLDGRWLDESGIDRLATVEAGQRFPDVPRAGLYWRFAELGRHRRGGRAT